MGCSGVAGGDRGRTHVDPALAKRLRGRADNDAPAADVGVVLDTPSVEMELDHSRLWLVVARDLHVEEVRCTAVVPVLDRRRVPDLDRELRRERRPAEVVVGLPPLHPRRPPTVGTPGGASAKGTWVHVEHPAAEGKLVRGEHGLHVGDRLRVELLSTDVERGFVDFARSNS
jgi:hypothetical protein